jgi:hypothetical protein
MLTTEGPTCSTSSVKSGKPRTPATGCAATGVTGKTAKTPVNASMQAKAGLRKVFESILSIIDLSSIKIDPPLGRPASPKR